VELPPERKRKLGKRN